MEEILFYNEIKDLLKKTNPTLIRNTMWSFNKSTLHLPWAGNVSSGCEVSKIIPNCVGNTDKTENPQKKIKL